MLTSVCLMTLCFILTTVLVVIDTSNCELSIKSRRFLSIVNLITWASQRETKLKIALRVFFFLFLFLFFFFCFPHSVTNRRLGLKTHAQVILSVHGFAWVGHFLVDDFHVFRRKTQLFEVVHRKKNYLGILNSFDSGNPRNNGKETVLRVQIIIVVLSRRRVSGARTSQILIQATDFLQNF